MRGSASSVESEASVSVLEPLFLWLGVSDTLTMTRMVRKGAHMAEFAVLCGLGHLAAKAWWDDAPQGWVWQAMAWIAMPSVDEALQLFVPGRSGQLTDVLIDMGGGLVGMALVALARKLVRR